VVVVPELASVALLVVLATPVAEPALSVALVVALVSANVARGWVVAVQLPPCLHVHHLCHHIHHRQVSQWIKLRVRGHRLRSQW